MLRKTSLCRGGERNGEPQREPCLSCTVHLSAPEKAFESHSDLPPSAFTEASETKYVKDKLRPAPKRPPVPSFLIRDTSTRTPLHILRGPQGRKTSTRIFVICHFFRGPAHSEAPSSGFMQSDLRMPRSTSRTANSDRGSLNESNPYLLRGLEKRKTSRRKFVFFGKFAKPRGSHGEGN